MSANSKLTTAVHALCWLELSRRRGVQVLSSERVAASLKSHPVLVRRCLGDLRAAGIVESSRGPGSGWSLARDADRITLLDVQMALGERDVFALHPHEPNLDCPVGFGIRPVLGDLYADIREGVERHLAGQTIRDVLDRSLAISAPTGL
jgi:Rrf2 family protein